MDKTASWEWMLGSLKDYFASTSSSRQGIPLRATLSDLNRAGNWILPQPRSDAMLQAHIGLTIISLVEEEDIYEWDRILSFRTTYPSISSSLMQMWVKMEVTL
ncbi:hypothetical protein HID58_016082 [Brassica napus]|uniref:Uncharacterized protein n=1 Tax=Brassica napus TaxID=3708 RepID=A0ABQ8DPC8_BRANA|nr:hypothetical protein HID58_016082 [Brassica napus]